jgi:uncharacterized protein YyaL (SSP411 family)
MSVNELSQAASPYLLQHAGNPVHWRMWTPSALQEARDLNKPILLSVGYAACHWCHVMAHESFEDAETAAVMNELFVNIKVDREERPDIDHIYMTSLQAFGQSGGWPLTMFLTPAGEAFWGGTYFPRTAQYGRPAFVDVLKSVAQAFRAEPQSIAHNANAVRETLAQAAQSAGREKGGSLSLEQLNALAAQVIRAVDSTNGGLRGAPKFPNAPVFEFLWRAGARLKTSPYRDLVTLTLTRMSEGGVCDHLGGGYARYSTDERWLVPHFEKMLYDNAQILELLALCYAESGDELFRTRAMETVSWLRRDMTHADGAFCASLDADSEGAEGKFYVWTWEELVEILGHEEASFFGKFYGASDRGNWADEAHGGIVTILNRLEAKRPTPEEEARLAPLRHKLFEARERRVHPGLDDKIMADWNGLMIAALVNAATLLNEPEWIQLAARAYDVIVSKMQFSDAENRKRLAHSWRAGVLIRPGMALDHAAMIRAALALYEARKWPGLSSILDKDYLADAICWAEALETHHRDAQTGLLCMAAKDATDVILRLSPTADDAIPNAHPVYASALVRLAGLSGDDRWLKRADELFEALGPAVRANFIAHAGVLNAFDLRLRVKTIVTAGPKRQELYLAALSIPSVERIVMDIDQEIPVGHVARAQADSAGDAAAFVCSGGTCSLPIREKRALFDTLGSINQAEISNG